MAKKWYVIHTYSGYENKVKANLEHRIESMGMADKIFEVLIPKETVTEIKQGGRKVTSEKKVFPGYILVQMELDDDSWYVVRNTPGVTGFVGSQAKPVALSRDEVKRIRRSVTGGAKPKSFTEFGTGEGDRRAARGLRRYHRGGQRRSGQDQGHGLDLRP
jgi:transcriptional antiterminator NusG